MKRLSFNKNKLFLTLNSLKNVTSVHNWVQYEFSIFCIFFTQGNAALLLANLEKEKELLRIFLRVSQMENAVLRRMNLNSFLMVSWSIIMCVYVCVYVFHFFILNLILLTIVRNVMLKNRFILFEKLV